MIPWLFLYLYKKYIHRQDERNAGMLYIKYAVIILLLSALLIAIPALPQKTDLKYNIKHGTTVIGSFNVSINTAENSSSITLESHVKTGFIISISVNIKEESIFKNGVFQYSRIFREINGTEKINKKCSAYGSGYIVVNKGRADTFCCTSIQYNLMNMYNSEPVGLNKVYSDNFQQFLAVSNNGAHEYRINLPDGTYQEYYYKNGLCIKVVMHHTLYTYTLELI